MATFHRNSFCSASGFGVESVLAVMPKWIWPNVFYLDDKGKHHLLCDFVLNIQVSSRFPLRKAQPQGFNHLSISEVSPP